MDDHLPLDRQCCCTWKVYWGIISHSVAFSFFTFHYTCSSSYNFFSALTAFALLDMLGLIIIPKQPQYGITQTRDHPQPRTPNFLESGSIEWLLFSSVEDHHWKDFCSSFGDHCTGSGEPSHAEGWENSVGALGRQLWQQVEEGKEEKVKGD